MTAPMIRTAIATALLAMAAPAFADPAANSEKLVINTSGLNLATPAGQQALNERLDSAIERMCSAEVFASIDYDAMDECRTAVRAEVQPQIRAMLPATTLAALR
jgi:UrcA family protein